MTADPGSVAVFIGDRASGIEVRDNLIGVTADGSVPLGATSSGIISAGAQTLIAGNTVHASSEGISVLSETATGSVVRDNRIGAGSAGAWATQGTGVRVDGAPDVQVLDNVVVAGQLADGRAAAISITGVPQAYLAGDKDDELRFVHYQDPDGEQDGDATGTGIVVAGNTLGSVAAGVAGGPNEAPDGVQVWAAASKVTITDNLVHGPGATGMVLDGSTQVTATGNRIAPDAPGTAPAVAVSVRGGENVTLGNDESGNVLVATTIGVEVGEAATAVAVLANQVTTPDAAAESACVQATVPARVLGNTLDCARGVTFAADGTPVVGPLVQDNVLRVDELGIGVEADNAVITGNDVTGGDRAGITVTGADAAVEDNQVTDATVGIAVDGTDSQVNDNTITDAAGDGIAVGTGPGHLRGNTVVGSGGRGIAVSPAAAAVTLRGNRIADTVGDPIDADAGPAAPTIAAVVLDTSDDTARTTLVLTGVPTDGNGTLELFANDSCSDGEAEQVLGVVKDVGSRDTVAVRLLGRASTDHFTAVYTDADGSSSELSECAEVSDHPDTDNDGVVDPIDALSGVEDDPSRVTLVTDDGQLLSLTAVGVAGEDVRFTDAAVADDPAPSGHAGVALPFGVVRFTIDGVEPGGRAAVRFVVLDGDPLPASAGYWKYGRPGAGQPLGWYEFTEDPQSQTGASVLDPVDVPGYGFRRPLAVFLADGGRGDLDGQVNGRIVDPGAISATSSGPRPDEAGSAADGVADPFDGADVLGDGPTGTGPAGTGLPDTGGPWRELPLVAVWLIGLGVWLVRRQPRGC